MTTKHRQLVVLVFVAVILALAAGHTQAADQYWTNDLAGGNFTNAAKWMSGTVPGMPDYAWFTNAAAPEIGRAHV